MKKENKRDYLIALLWLIIGYLCSFSAVYLFSYGTVNWVLPVNRYVRTMFQSPIMSTMTNVVMCYIAQFITAFSFALVFSITTGRRRLWLLFFAIGAMGQSFYYDIESLNAYMNYYPSGLPSWTKSFYYNEITVYFIIIPVVAWIGMMLGNKIYTKKQNKSVHADAG
jgi:hypothetical protein